MKRTRIFSAAAGLILIATAAQAQRGQDDRRNRQDQRGQAPPQEQQHRNDDNRQRVESRQRAVDQARAEQARAAEIENQRRAAQHDEQQRYQQARQREQREQLERAERVRRDEQLERAERLRQKEQLERAERIRQEERLEQARRAQINQAYDRDRVYRPGYDYRYNMGGVYRETNQYGVGSLRQAVSLGYQQGYRAGQMDRRDRLRADCRRSIEYQNADYGFTGNYVPQDDYRYYFREGFQRGYDDGFANSARYGTFSNGNPSILSDIVSSILGLTTIR